MSARAIRRRLGVEGLERITAAVAAAEARTTAEIVVWVRPRTFWTACLGRHRGDAAGVRRAAERQFVRAGLTATAERNAVLLYVSLDERVVVVLGDEGIDRVAPPDSWAPIAAAVSEAARRGALAEGLVTAVGRLGDALAVHFPVVHGTENPDELGNAPRLG